MFSGERKDWHAPDIRPRKVFSIEIPTKFGLFGSDLYLATNGGTVLLVAAAVSHRVVPRVSRRAQRGTPELPDDKEFIQMFGSRDRYVHISWSNERIIRFESKLAKLSDIAEGQTQMSKFGERLIVSFAKQVDSLGQKRHRNR